MGKTLTGVGELIMDTDGSLNLRPPSNSSHYFLSIMDFDTLRQEQKDMVLWWKMVAIASVVVGAAVVFSVGWRYYKHLKHRRNLKQARKEFERLTAEASGAPPAGAADDLVENACIICLSNQRNCILLECGHVCCCFSCYQSLPRHLCPICRQDIRRVVPLYHV